MSITRGIEIIKRYPGADNSMNKSNFVSWKDSSFDMWVSEWIFTYISAREIDKRDNDCWSFFIKKEYLLKMANDLIDRRFSVCPRTYNSFFYGSEEEYAVRFGLAFKELAEKVKDDELLRYYDCGN